MAKKLINVLVVLAVATAGLSAQPRMSHEEAMQKADELISRLTLQEKCDMTHGYQKFFLPGVPEKGIPYVYVADASTGFRISKTIPREVRAEKSTRFPSSIALAATFNPEIAYDYAEAVGEEFRMVGASVLLGPGFNIYRNSQCGRNFEYMGEDPYLASRMVEQYVQGAQSTGTMSCIKHFVANNTEFYRKRSNSIVDERTLMEIYIPAFQAGIDAGAGAVMTSYNLLNGEWTGQSKYVITDLLRGRLGFKGMVVSDWESIYDWEKVILSGQNVDMPGTDYFYCEDDAAGLVAKGVVTEEDIENMIRPQIAACIQFGLYERNLNGEEYKWELKERLTAHAEVAYKTAAEATVLLSNNGILPFKAEGDVLLCGRWANTVPAGGGSSKVEGYDHITYADALRKVLGDRLTVVEFPTAEQIKAARTVILATGTLNTENAEMAFAMDKKYEDQVRLVVENNPNTIVVINSGGGIDMSAWHDKAAAIVHGWYPGQNGCQAIVDILMGKINPSGKLPMTIEKSFADSPAVNTVPKGANIGKAFLNPNEYFFRVYDVHYDEGVLVGYRWYEAKNIEPLYPFGHGLSYTTFALEKPKISGKGKVKSISADKPVQVSVTVKNTGSVAGSEVIQLYVGENNPTVVRPVKELKGFRKIELAPGEKTVVTFELKASDLAFWDETIKDWKTNPGDYTVFLGTSSARISHTIHLKAL